MIIPAKLRIGDQIRVVAPARSLSLITSATREIATETLQKMGLKVTFSRNCEASDQFLSASIAERVADLHEAFLDPAVKGVLTVIGGYNSNQLLRELDYDLIKTHPKILCGYSDITALANAIYQQTGLVTYSGPHYSTFGMQQGSEYTIEYFQKCLFDEAEFLVNPATTWSDDPWYLDQANRTFYPNQGYQVLVPGKAVGKSLGGNLGTLNLLQGTEFMPDLKDSILWLEDDELTFPETFDRTLQSLIQQPGFNQVRGIILGRFQLASKLKIEVLREIVKAKKELQQIPIVAEVDFGHTTPQLTFPIGGRVELDANQAGVTLKIKEH